MVTPVIPSSYQTDRTDLDAALTALLDAFIVSESYGVGRVWQSSIPDNLAAEGPMIVMGDVTESIAHDAQTRRTVFSGSLFYVDFITDRDELNTRVNRWADRMRDLFTYNASLVSATAVLVQTGFSEAEFSQGSLVFAAPSIQFEYRVLQGYR